MADRLTFAAQSNFLVLPDSSRQSADLTKVITMPYTFWGGTCETSQDYDLSAGETLPGRSGELVRWAKSQTGDAIISRFECVSEEVRGNGRRPRIIRVFAEHF